MYYGTVRSTRLRKTQVSLPTERLKEDLALRPRFVAYRDQREIRYTSCSGLAFS